MNERNMLFGLIAVREKKIAVDQIATLAEQTLAAQTDLGSLLVAAGTISEEDRKALEDSVAHTIQQHGGLQEALRTLDADEEALRTLSRSLFGDVSHAETLVTAATTERSQMETIQSVDPADRSSMATIQSVETGNGDRSSMATIASAPTIERSAMETIASEGDTRDASTKAAATKPMFNVDSVTLVGLHGKPGQRPKSDTPVPAVCEHDGRYKMIKAFGAGGMGQIYLVHDTHLGRDIALKTLLPDRVPGGGNKTRTRTGAPTMEVLTVPIIARFLQEAHVTGQLQHPGIIPIYELGYRPDGTLYYTMQFLRGQSIQDKLKDATTLQERLPLLTNFLDACQAIGYAHSRGVIHRDIKPMNIMTGAYGETVVIDWGIAKVKGEMDIHAKDIKETVKVMQIGDTAATARTMYGQTIGSPFYMPPEQAAGKTDEVDERADIYALGALLYVILTGVPPYHGMNVREFLVKVQEFEPKPVLELQKDAPKELAAVVKKAMARKREDRYQTAMELADEVQRYLSGGLVSAYQYRMSELIKRFYKRNKRMITVVATATTLLLTAITLGVIAVTIQRAIARRELYFANINIAQDAIDERTPEAARKRLADAPPEHNNWEWGYLAHEANADLMTIPFAGQNVAYGEGFIVVANDKGEAKVYNAETGEETHTLAEKSGAGFGFDFAKASGRIAILGDDGLHVWEANTGTEIYRFEDKPYEAEQINRQVSLSNDGRLVAFVTTDGNARVVNLESKQELYFAPIELTKAVIKLSGDGALLVKVSIDAATMTSQIEVADITSNATVGAVEVENGEFVKTVAIAPQNNFIAIGTDNSLRVFTAPDCSAVFQAPPKQDENAFAPAEGVSVRFNVPHTVAFSPDGKYVAAGTTDGRLGLWETATGAENDLELFAHGDQVRTVEFSPDGRHLATASFDGGAQIWELPNALNQKLRAAHEFIGHDGPLWSLDFSPDGTRLATTAFGDTTKLWDLQADGELHKPGQMAFDPQHDWSAGTLGKEVAVWDARTQHRLATLGGHADAVKNLAFAPDSAHLASLSIPAKADAPSEVRVWSLPNGDLAGTLPVAHKTTSIALAQNATLLVTRDGGTARIYKVADGSVAFEGKTSGNVVVDNTGSRAAFIVASEDKPGQFTVNVVDLKTLQAAPARGLQSKPNTVPTLAFDQQGKWLATSTWDADGKVSLVLFSLADDSSITLPTAHTNKVIAITFNPEGTLVATGGADFEINVFAVEEGAQPRVLAGHSGSITALSFAPHFSVPLNASQLLSPANNTRLASASLDKTFRLWNVERAATIMTVQDSAQHAKGDVINPDKVAFNATGDLLATITRPAVAPFIERAFPWHTTEYAPPEVDPETTPEEDLPLLTFKHMMEDYKRGLWQKQ